MITLQDCMALSDLSEEEIEAIAEHEHLPGALAAELGSYLARRADGAPIIRRMILDDIAAAEARGDQLHAQRLRLVLKHFCDEHPDDGDKRRGDAAAAPVPPRGVR